MLSAPSHSSTSQPGFRIFCPFPSLYLRISQGVFHKAIVFTDFLTDAFMSCLRSSLDFTTITYEPGKSLSTQPQCPTFVINEQNLRGSKPIPKSIVCHPLLKLPSGTWKSMSSAQERLQLWAQGLRVSTTPLEFMLQEWGSHCSCLAPEKGVKYESLR
jgi:hypothetical protein